ncbi:MAG: hypothetical protein ACI8XM_000614, partial [Haloarculaceae archaeon]
MGTANSINSSVDQYNRQSTAMTSDRLLLDTMLGKLATYLRMCGYDTVYTLDEGIEDDDAVLALATEQDRTVV